MRKTYLAAALLCAFAVAGCDLATIQSSYTANIIALETKVAALVAKIKADAPIVIADIKAGISAACTVVPLGNSSIASVQANLSNPSSKVQNYLNVAADAGLKAQVACDKYAATQANAPTVSSGANTVLAVWNGYQAAKSNLTAAQQALPAGAQ